MGEVWIYYLLAKGIARKAVHNRLYELARAGQLPEYNQDFADLLSALANSELAKYDYDERAVVKFNDDGSLDLELIVPSPEDSIDDKESEID